MTEVQAQSASAAHASFDTHLVPELGMRANLRSVPRTSLPYRTGH